MTPGLLLLLSAFGFSPGVGERLRGTVRSPFLTLTSTLPMRCGEAKRIRSTES
jgi:hypothetical protein